MKPLFIPILIINLIAAYWGFTVFYGEQLSQTPIYFSVFVPDCPLYVLLFAIAIILISINLIWSFPRSSRISKLFSLFYFVVAVGMIKYSIWTISVLLGYSSYFFTINPNTSIVLLAAHFLMFFEAFVLVREGFKNYSDHFPTIALSWFFLNDIMDYVFGLHPYLPETTWLLIAFTFALSIFSTFAIIKLRDSKRIDLFRNLVLD